MLFSFLVGIFILDSMVKLAGGLLRCGLRCFSYLQPDVNRASSREDEPDLIIKLHALAFWKQEKSRTYFTN